MAHQLQPFIFIYYSIYFGSPRHEARRRWNLHQGSPWKTTNCPVGQRVATVYLNPRLPGPERTTNQKNNYPAAKLRLGCHNPLSSWNCQGPGSPLSAKSKHVGWSKALPHSLPRRNPLLPTPQRLSAPHIPNKANFNRTQGIFMTDVFFQGPVQRLLNTPDPEAYIFVILSNLECI